MESMESEIFHLPTLFGKDKNGNVRVWKTWVDGDVIFQKFGLLKKKDGSKGKRIVNERTIKGVNIGDADETTPEEQAKRVAETDWTHQLDKNYKPSPKDKEGTAQYLKVIESKKGYGGHNINAASNLRERKKVNTTLIPSLFVDMESNVFPMKATAWEFEPKCEKYFNFEKGVFVQCKLDGWRCLALKQIGGVSLSTNTSKQYPWFSELRKELSLIFEKFGVGGLDGELYAENIKDCENDAKFSLIQGICSLRNKKPHLQENKIKFFVFDVFDETKKQADRFKILDEIFEQEYKYIERVTTLKITNPESISTFHDECIKRGYEGVVLRAHDCMYQQKSRSSKMRKHKNFDDAEFKVIGCQCDEGVGVEHFVWLCQTDNDEFKAKPWGTAAQKKEWFKNQDKFIGKMLTVKYQGVSKDGIPRFPIAKEFRDLKEN